MNNLEVISFILPLLTALGGGIVGAYFQSIFNQLDKINQAQLEYKKKRYLCIMVLMAALINPEKKLADLQLRRSEIKTVEDLKEELNREALQATIYASDKMIKALTDFVHTPTSKQFIKTVKAMRRDLWGIWGRTTKIDEFVVEKLI